MTPSSLTTIDPATGATLETYTYDDDATVDAALTRAHTAQRTWSTTSFDERAANLRAVASSLRASSEDAAAIMTAEMGKTLDEARAEVEKCAWVCEHYADHGERYLTDEAIDTDWTDSYVQFPPLGVVLAVMPWNYPFWQVLRAGAPALMAGNSLVLKHASNVTGSALVLQEIFDRAGLVAPLLSTVVVPGSGVARIIDDDRIAAVTLTGSEAAGIAVATACAAQLKKSVLELGGSDAYVVLEDADLESAAETAVKARFQNAGQSCIAAKRLIVVEQVAAEFEERVVAATERLRVGDSRVQDADLGPMARVDLRDELADQVSRAVAAGGRVLTGGVDNPGEGAFFRPTIVSGVAPGNPIFVEETFGPAASITRVSDEDEAIRLANDSAFGLSASLWTQDLDRARRLSRRFASGAVFVNTMSATDPRMPIGGVKRSGWGRELGPHGIREFTNTQAVTIAPRVG